MKNPHEVVAVGQIVTVWVKSIDQERGKINLTLVEPVNNEELTDYVRRLL